MIAADNDNAEMVGSALDKKANIHKKTRVMPRACFLAGNADVVKMLLDKGADVNVKAQGGATAWMLASVTGDPKIPGIWKERGVR